MNSTHKHAKQVAVISIIAGFLAAASLLLLAAGANFNMDAFSNPQLLLGMIDANSQFLKWGMVTDMFGYYLLLLPALFYFHRIIKDKTPWSQLISLCGVAYVLVGAIGASILSVVWPSLVVEYPMSTVAEQQVIFGTFSLANQIVNGGLWNTLEVLLAGIWWLGLGLAMRKEHTAFGNLTVILGLASLMDGFGNILGLQPMAELGLSMYLVLGIIWPFCVAAILIRKKSNAKAKHEKFNGAMARQREPHPSYY